MSIYLVTIDTLNGTSVQKIAAEDEEAARIRAKRIFRHARIVAVDYGWPYFR